MLTVDVCCVQGPLEGEGEGAARRREGGGEQGV